MRQGNSTHLQSVFGDRHSLQDGNDFDHSFHVHNLSAQRNINNNKITLVIPSTHPVIMNWKIFLNYLHTLQKLCELKENSLEKTIIGCCEATLHYIGGVISVVL